MKPPAARASETAQEGWEHRVAWLLTALGVGYAALLHHGLGPAPSRREPHWFDPSGFLLESLAGGPFAALGEDVRGALVAFLLPALALAVAVFALTRAVLPRVLCVIAGISVPLFVFYGIQAPLVWAFFHWRWSASMGLFASIVGCAAAAPLLVAGWLRLSPTGRLFSYLPLFAGVLLLEREVTGTDPALPFAISPWPAVQVFGLDAAASLIAALLIGAALGLAVLRLAFRRRGPLRLLLVLVAAALAGGVPPGWLAYAGRSDLLSFPVGRPLLGAAAAAGGIAFVAAAAAMRETTLARRARLWGIAGVLVALPLVLGQVLVRGDYLATREQRAGRLIEALATHYAREEIYPDRLEQLVEAGRLDAIPHPRIGFGLMGRPEFIYQSFGTSFLLEFNAPRWIQCAYNPPYEEEEEEEEEDGGGAWSCPSRPPDLW